MPLIINPRLFRFVIGEIAHTILVLEPWKDPYALRRAFCVGEMALTARLGTIVGTESLPPAAAAAMGGGASHVLVPHRFSIAMTSAQQDAFDQALHSDYSAVEALLGVISKMDVLAAEVRRRSDRERILRALELGIVKPDDRAAADATAAALALGAASDSSSSDSRTLPDAVPMPPPVNAVFSPHDGSAVEGEQGETVYLPLPSEVVPPSFGGPSHASFSPAQKHLAHHSNAAARTLLRKCLVAHARKLLAKVPLEARRGTSLVTHMDMLLKQVAVDALRDKLGDEHPETLEAITTLATALRDGGDDSTYKTACYQPPKVARSSSDCF